MPDPTMLSIAIAVGIGLWLILIYNRLVRARALVREGWSGIIVQLRRRADLVPNLVAAVEGYAAHERGLIEEVTARRADVMRARDAASSASASTALGGVLDRLLMVAEAYPELKADANFRALQEDLAEIETELQGARRYYNATVRDLNTRVGSFPDLLIARPFGFVEQQSFEDGDAALAAAPAIRFGKED